VVGGIWFFVIYFWKKAGGLSCSIFWILNSCGDILASICPWCPDTK
jgi:hypothetical protein